MKQWEVQEHTACDGWVNVWIDDDGNPLRFNSLPEAQKELNELLDEIQEAVADGNMAEEYDPANFRVVGVCS